ncbi:bone morphogenetic protein receptor type-2 [Bacillus rossius redtenbacheri]|uniref:bone morphogenetic protein receptor type-2 n=1 Tax=Bacillus rossius redtenbacheri TaxID=93214 RepID=UPI002FDE8D3D
MDKSLLVLMVAALNHAEGSQVVEQRSCAHVYRSVEHLSVQRSPYEDSSEDYSTAEILDIGGQKVEKCTKSTNHCYALWQEDTSSNGSTVIIMGQGCWESSGKQDCERPQCVADKKPPKALNNTKFCCCASDLCNLNVSDIYVPPADTRSLLTATQQYLDQVSELRVLYIALSCTLGPGFVVLVALALYWLRHNYTHGKGKHSPDTMHLMEGGLHLGGYTLEHLKLSAIVGQGRYGSVWRGSVHDQEVAVKIFPSHYRGYFHNERDLYSLPFIDNPALLSYYGCEERVGPDGCVEYLLVLSYAPNGCLQDYLRSNTLDWPTFCKMALTVAKGLAHLHTDVRKGDKVKPCVTHRDLNTRNILVKADLSCCLCDLGFAMKICGSKYFCNGEEQHAETKSINDVGTLRYMAPEVLEGAVNLRDCESSLKQIDVYALGLVLWELASRCSDLCRPGSEVPPYRLPFEAEVGHHPTFEQMQVLVSRHKARPLFPEPWRDWAAVRLVRETAEDCWDQDAEARLTALCVEERMQELPALWDRQRGVSPTVNLTHAGAQPPVCRPSINNGSMLIGCDSNRLYQDCLAEDTGGSVQSASQSSAAGKEAQEGTVSEGTVETLVTLSPSEPQPDPAHKNANRAAGNSYNYSLGSASLLQPYQGRNPCMERNLMLQALSDDELACQGNTLVDRSLKHVAETRALVPHDALGSSQPAARPATPIPYVQNAVRGPGTSVPKQPNVAGSGSAWRGWGGLRRRLFGARPSRDKRCLLPAVETRVSLRPGGGGRRPATLPLDQVFRCKSNVSAARLRHPHTRVKTPGDVPPSVRRPRARLSLYDDRMMAPGLSCELLCKDERASSF